MIRLRLVAATLVVVVGSLLAAVFVSRQKDLEPGTYKTQNEVFVSSPLVGLVPSVERRADVFALLGLEGELRRRIDEGLRRYDGRREEIEAGLTRARRETLAGAFCPHDLPPLYRAAILLIEGEPGQTRVLSPLDDRFGAEWPAFPGRDVSTLFDTWEQRRDRAPGDTLLALSALVMGRVEDAIGQRSEPFQRFVAEGGGLDAVERVNADAPRILGDYLAATLAISGIVAADPEKYGCSGAAPAAPPSDR